MDNILSKLTKLFDDFIGEASHYGFKNNSGKRTCIKDLNIGANCDNNISEVIKMRDFLYFVLRQVFHNYSYEKMNSMMKCEKKNKCNNRCIRKTKNPKKLYDIS